MPNPYFEKESSGIYLTAIKSEDMGVHTLPKGICPKVNMIAWHSYYDSVVQRFKPFTQRGHKLHNPRLPYIYI